MSNMSDTEILEQMTFRALSRVLHLGQNEFDSVFDRGMVEWYLQYRVDHPDEAKDAEQHRIAFYPESVDITRVHLKPTKETP